MRVTTSPRAQLSVRRTSSCSAFSRLASRAWSRPVSAQCESCDARSQPASPTRHGQKNVTAGRAQPLAVSPCPDPVSGSTAQSSCRIRSRRSASTQPPLCLSIVPAALHPSARSEARRPTSCQRPVARGSGPTCPEGCLRALFEASDAAPWRHRPGRRTWPRSRTAQPRCHRPCTSKVFSRPAAALLLCACLWRYTCLPPSGGQGLACVVLFRSAGIRWSRGSGGVVGTRAARPCQR